VQAVPDALILVCEDGRSLPAADKAAEISDGACCAPAPADHADRLSPGRRVSAVEDSAGRPYPACVLPAGIILWLACAPGQ
jgi:hypothetical protein